MTVTGTIEYEIVEAVAPVDRAVFSGDWNAPDDPHARLALIRDSVRWHLASAPAYAGYADRLGFDPDRLAAPGDLASVPQIPTLAFKRGVPIRSCPADRIAKRCTSSGTLGRRSEVLRDRSTIERLLGSVRRGVELLGDWYEDDVAVLNLGPDQAEAGDLWFAYVMSLVELPYLASHAVRDGHFDPPAAADRLAALRKEYPVVIVTGPPGLVLELANAAPADAARRQDGELMVVTAGGWKRHTGAVLPRAEFTDAVVGRLGLTGPDRVRDAFNQVELNTVVLECAARRKHVPPWLEVIVRDPLTLEPVGAGTGGLLSYLDPSATSYPCFLLADDFGVLRADPCECGRPGRTLELHRRIKRPEEWGCALKMDRAYLPEGA